MQCAKPLYVELVDLYVPCGKCRQCRIARAREWATRLVHEVSCHEEALFLTLTYDDEHLPADEAINKPCLQRYFKRLRKHLGDRKIKYYACGEYGDKHGRPHYHALVYGIGFDDKELVMKAWKNGNVYAGTVTYDSARYVADYIQKDNRPEKNGNRTPPFAIMSQGLGKEYAEANKSQILDNMNITIRGVDCGIPRYYRKILDIPEEKVIQVAQERKEALEKWYEEKFLGPEETWYRVVESRKQATKNIRAKQEMWKKGKM